MLAQGPEGASARITLESDGPNDMGLFLCEDDPYGICKVAVSLDGKPPLELRACISESGHLRFDSTRKLINGLRASRVAEVAVPVLDGNDIRTVSFRFAVSGLRFNAPHTSGFCDREML